MNSESKPLADAIFRERVVHDVIAAQGNTALDWEYIHHRTTVHGTREQLDAVCGSIPPLD